MRQTFVSYSLLINSILMKSLKSIKIVTYFFFNLFFITAVFSQDFKPHVDAYLAEHS
jgi:hypothetical protein